MKRRLLSALLAGCMLLGLLPGGALALEEGEGQALPLRDLSALEGADYPAGGGFAIAADSAALEERGTYLVTVRRLGGGEEASSVELRTVDLSALYGADYELVQTGEVDTDAHPGEKTLIQQGLEEEYLQNLEEYQKALENTMEAIDPEEPEEPEPPAPTEAPADPAPQETEIPDPPTALAASALEELERRGLGDFLRDSSATLLTFAPGESEKTVAVQVLEDEEAEGDERFQLVLAAPSDNAVLTEASVCTLTIRDDEPVERATLSFSQEDYTAQGDSVTLKVVREGAPWTLVTARLRTLDGGEAVAREDYQKADAELALPPYVTEQEITLTVRPGADVTFRVALEDIKGGDAGAVPTATVAVPGEAGLTGPMDLGPSTLAPVSAQEGAALMAEEDEEKHFDITVGDATYTVVYTPGAATGVIYDQSKVPAVALGDYYFMNDQAHGGLFQYDLTGSKCNNRSAKFQAGDDGGSAYLRWYSSSIGKRGAARAYTGYQIDTSKYQSLAVDFQFNTGFSANHFDFRYEVQGKSYDFSYTNNGNVNRQLIPPIPLLDGDGKPVNEPGRFFCQVEDRSKGDTPNMTAKVYGVACFYRRFELALTAPDQKTYLAVDGGGGPICLQMPPAQVAAGVGHEIRYLGQPYQIKVTAAEQGGMVRGRLTGYTITLNPGTNNTSVFTYDVSKASNPNVLPFDDPAFVRTLESHMQASQTVSDGMGYHVKLSVKPVFAYRDLSVEVRAADHTKFNWADWTHPVTNAENMLAVGTHTFHVGDQISLATVPDSGWTHGGYRLTAYHSAGDTLPVADGAATALAPAEVTLTEAKYVLTPIATRAENTITVISGHLDSTALRATDVHTGEALAGERTSDTVYTFRGVRAGQIYALEAIGLIRPGDVNNTVYHWKMEGDESRDYVGSFLPLVADADPQKNAYQLNSTYIVDHLWGSVEGYVTGPDQPILDTTLRQTDPAAGVTVTAGGYRTIAGSGEDRTVVPLRYSTETRSDGYFRLDGIQMYSLHDAVRILVDNGDVQTVQELTYGGLSSGEVTFQRLEGTAAGLESKTYSRRCYVAEGNVSLPARSASAPYVSALSYAYESGRNAAGGVGDVRDSEVAILDDTLLVTARLQLRGRQVKSADFIVTHQHGADTVFSVASTAPDQNTFTARIPMKDPERGLEPGDLLYLRLVDAEDVTYTTVVYDEAGTATETPVTRPRNYARVFTGLSFYEPTLESEPRYYNFPEAAVGENIPLIEDLTGMVGTGGLSVQKKYLSHVGAHPAYAWTVGFDIGYGNIGTNPAAMLKNANALVQNKAGQAAAEAAVNANQAARKATLGSEVNGFYKGEFEHADQVTRDVVMDQTRQKSFAEMSKKIQFNVKINFVLADIYVYDADQDAYISVVSQYLVGVTGTVSRTQYWVAGGVVPLFVNYGGDVVVSVNGYTVDGRDTRRVADQFDNAENLYELYDGDLYATLLFDVKASVGVGIFGVLDARGNIMVQPVFDWIRDGNTGESLSGTRLNLSGGFTIDLVLFSLSYNPQFEAGRWGFYQDTPAGRTALSGAEDSPWSLRLLDAGTGDLSGFGAGDISLLSAPEAVHLTTILDGAAERVKPQLVQTESGKLVLLFLAAVDGRTGYNKLGLYYSVCDAMGVWSQPKLVEDDGTMDAFPFAAAQGDKVHILWIDGKKALNDGATLREALVNLSGVRYAKLDVSGETPELSEVHEPLNGGSDDLYYNPSMSFRKNGTRGVVYLPHLTFEEDAQTLQELMASVQAGKVESKTWREETNFNGLMSRTLKLTALDFSQGMTMGRGGDGVKAVDVALYTRDMDGDLTTAADQEVWLYLEDSLYDVGSGTPCGDPIPLTQDATADAAPQVTTLGDRLVLSWIKGGDTLCYAGLQPLIDELRAEKAALDPAQEADGKDLLAAIQDGRLEIHTRQFPDSRGEPLMIQDYQVTLGEDGNVYFFFAAADSAPENHSQELYAALYLPGGEWESDDGSNAAPAGLSDAVRVTRLAERAAAENEGENTGWVLDEFTAVVDEDSTITGVGNLFRQTLGQNGIEYGEHKLVGVTYAPAPSLEASLALETPIPVPGTPNRVLVTVANDGLWPADGFTVEVKCGEAVVGTADLDVPLPGGKHQTLAFPWTPEAVGAEPEELTATVKEKRNGSAMDPPATASLAVPAVEQLTCTDAHAGAKSFTATVINTGNQPIEATSIPVRSYLGGKDAESFGTLEVPALGLGETATVTAALTIPPEAFRLASTVLLTLGDVEGISLTGLPVVPVSVVLTVNGGEAVTLAEGESAPLTAALAPGDLDAAAVTFSTEDAEIIALQPGRRVAGLKAGTAAVTATDPATGVSVRVPVTVTAAPEVPEVPDVPSGGGGGTTTTTKTETNPDGSKTTVVTNKTTGTVTQTTRYPDGAVEKVVTKKDGTVTTTATAADGTRSESVLTADGAYTEAVRRPDGVRTEAKVDTVGATAEVTLPKDLPAALVSLPAGDGNVVLRVLEDGTEVVLPLSLVEDGRALVLLEGSAQLRLERREDYFDDVTGSAETAADFGAARGLWLGTGERTFSPDMGMSRAMLATILWRLDGQKSADRAASFADVPPESWYAQAVAWCVDREVTSGVGADCFAPDRGLTGRELIAMLYRAAALYGQPQSRRETPPEGTASWAAEAVGWALDAGLMDPEETEGLAAPVTRAQAAVLIRDFVEVLLKQ